MHVQEKRIYDLKKKNQELEKFKFVLDYKIKELRRQMEPRENEIKRMKEQIKKVSVVMTLCVELYTCHSYTRPLIFFFMIRYKTAWLTLPP